MSDETTEFDALTMDGGPFDSLRVTRMDDGGIKLSISRDSIVFMQEASGTMCAEDARELAKWLTPDVHEQLATVTAERDDYRSRFRDLERELQLERGQVVLMQQRTEAALTASSDELRRLMIDTDIILGELDPKEIKGAINWGDLGAREVTRVYDADHRSWLRMVIEEVSPGEEQLIAAVRAGLAAKGWDVSNIEIETDW